MYIGELAHRTGVSPRALRHYEQQGLLTSSREENGYRVYQEEALVVVRNIQDLLAHGLLIKDIQKMSGCLTIPDLAHTRLCAGAHQTYRKRQSMTLARLEKLQDQYQRLDQALAYSPAE